MAPATTHRWRFSRSGGFDQACLETSADFQHLGELDQKLWAALACPVKGLEFDERTLAMIDTDNDGRVRQPEVVAAVRFCTETLKDPSELRKGSDSLALSSINDAHPSGKAILTSARQILKDLGRGDSPSIGLADVADTTKIFVQMRFNGDGIVPADAAADDVTKKVIEDAVLCLGGTTDRSGKPGVDQAKLDLFFAELAALHEWTLKGESDATVMPLGAGTAGAADAWRAVRTKVDDWFARGKLAAFDARALPAVNRAGEEYLALATRDLSLSVLEVAGFPLAHVEPGKSLPLASGLNPAWAAAIGALRVHAVTPVYGAEKTSLTEVEWLAIGAKLGAYEAWLAGKPATSVEKLGIARVREILGGKSKDAITTLIGQDKALEPEVLAIVQIERLIRYNRDLNTLLRNFVNFSDFYSGDTPAVFQSGVLYLDQRSCELCVRVDDAGKHAALAGMAKAYLAYCDLTRPSGEKMHIAAAFTAGDSDFLLVGRNGIFFDRKGRDWDATITKVVENPISVRQAFWAPYKKLVRMIEEMVAKRAAAKDAESDAKLAAASTGVAAPPAEPKKIDIGTVAAMGVAVGAIGAFCTALIGHLTGLFNLPFWKLSLAVAGIMLAISLPSMLIAWLKLRQRNMAPILDANGWAVNGRVKMNVPFGGSLTSVAKLPEGWVPGPADPYGEKKSAWPGILKFVVIVCFVFSVINDADHGWLYDWTRPGTRFHEATGWTFGNRKLTEKEEKAAIAAKAKVEAEAEAQKPK